MSWRWYIPPKWHGVITLNFLEVFASEVSINMNIQKLGHRAHVKEFTDSSSDLMWIHKAYFDPVYEGGHDTVMRWLGWNLSVTRYPYIPNTSRELKTS